MNEFDGNSLGFPQGDRGTRGAHFAIPQDDQGADTEPLGGNSL